MFISSLLNSRKYLMKPNSNNSYGGYHSNPIESCTGRTELCLPHTHVGSGFSFALENDGNMKLNSSPPRTALHTDGKHVSVGQVLREARRSIGACAMIVSITVQS